MEIARICDPSAGVRHALAAHTVESASVVSCSVVIFAAGLTAKNQQEKDGEKGEEKKGREDMKKTTYLHCAWAVNAAGVTTATWRRKPVKQKEDDPNHSGHPQKHAALRGQKRGN